MNTVRKYKVTLSENLKEERILYDHFKIMRSLFDSEDKLFNYNAKFLFSRIKCIEAMLSNNSVDVDKWYKKNQEIACDMIEISGEDTDNVSLLCLDTSRLKYTESDKENAYLQMCNQLKASIDLLEEQIKLYKLMNSNGLKF